MTAGGQQNNVARARNMSLYSNGGSEGAGIGGSEISNLAGNNSDRLGGSLGLGLGNGIGVGAVQRLEGSKCTVS